MNDDPHDVSPRDARAAADPAGVPIDDVGPPRCPACGYLLVGLTRGACPECGRQFDLAVPATFETRPPFRFLTYWLPAAIALAAVWFVYGCLLIAGNAIGWALTLAVPATIGFMAGYGARPGRIARFWLYGVTFIGAIASLFYANMIGIFCGVALAAVGLVPYAIGVSFGTALRGAMKSSSRYPQRHYLPLLLALCVPAFVELAERRLGTTPAVVAQATPILLHATLDEAWHARVGDAPDVGGRSVLHAAHLTLPLEQSGPRGVGARSTIRLSTGTLDVVVRTRDEPRRFEFAYVGQSHVEDRAIRLLDTSFDYASVAPSTTRLTITTRYQPLMTPRWAWQPFEHWAGAATHELIGRQMQRSVDVRHDEVRQIIEAEKASAQSTRSPEGN